MTLWIINLLFVIIKKDNKIICFITYLTLGILFVSNAGLSGDAALYKWHFENKVFSGELFEVGYTFAEKIFHACGIHTYTGFLIVLFVLGTIFLWIGLKKYNISYHYLLLITMPFIFPTYSIAIRFYLASAIMVAAIRYLNERKYWLFFIFVICAGSFHVVALFYLLFVFCGTKRMSAISLNKKFLLWLVGIFSVLNFIISILLKKNLLILALVKIITAVFIIGENKIDAYTTTNTNFGGIIFLFTYLCGMVTAIYIYRLVFDERRTTDKNNEQTINVIKTYSKVNYNINLILSTILPFIAMNLLFYRLLTIGHISNAIVLGMYRKQNLSKRRRGSIQISPVNVFFILSCLSWFIPEIIGFNDITIKGLFEASILFGK
ncbi:EpsG family protein [Acetatifactor muris]|nr:EpsG family protein [Acetatifactor muris]MCR2047481.1 EpsG family protein [Acetatifactor muris]